MGCGLSSKRSAPTEASVVDASEIQYPRMDTYYTKQEGTEFADHLHRGCVGVVKARYFEACLNKGETFQDRANIPNEFFFAGPEAVELWERCGYFFLAVVTYPWLSRGHPDPEMFHLRKLVRILRELRSVFHKAFDLLRLERCDISEVDIAVIIDFCSLWQKHGEDETRTEEQLQQFKEGLKSINVPYGHQEVTVVKLMATPVAEIRKYEDRGWTFFESAIVDGKGGSKKYGGLPSVLTFDDTFDAECESKTGTDFLRQFSCFRRSPPLTPERFEQELEVRRKRAVEKHVTLFTNGKDQPFILEKYHEAYAEFTKSTGLAYCNMTPIWNKAELNELGRALPDFLSLRQLHLEDIGIDPATALASTLLALPALQVLNLSDNGTGDEGAVALACTLRSALALRALHLRDNSIGDKGATALAGVLRHMPVLELLDLHRNRIRDQGGKALAGASGANKSLRLLLSDNLIGEGAVAALKAKSQMKGIVLFV